MSRNLIIVERDRTDARRRYTVSDRLCLQPYSSGQSVIVPTWGGAYELVSELLLIEGVRTASVDLLWLEIELELDYADMPSVHQQVVDRIKQVLQWKDCEIVVRERYDTSAFSRELLEIMSRQTGHPLGALDGLVRPRVRDPFLDDPFTNDSVRLMNGPESLSARVTPYL